MCCKYCSMVKLLTLHALIGDPVWYQGLKSWSAYTMMSIDHVFYMVPVHWNTPTSQLIYAFHAPEQVWKCKWAMAANGHVILSLFSIEACLFARETCITFPSGWLLFYFICQYRKCHRHAYIPVCSLLCIPNPHQAWLELWALRTCVWLSQKASRVVCVALLPTASFAEHTTGLPVCMSTAKMKLLRMYNQYGRGCDWCKSVANNNASLET